MLGVASLLAVFLGLRLIDYSALSPSLRLRAGGCAGNSVHHPLRRDRRPLGSCLLPEPERPGTDRGGGAQPVQEPYVIGAGAHGRRHHASGGRSDAAGTAPEGQPERQELYRPRRAPPADEKDREIVSFDGRVLVTRFIDKDAAVRYGNMVYVRCAPRLSATRCVESRWQSPDVMHKLRDLVLGPGRAVLVLSLTQILAWGILIYPPVLTMPHMAADHGWSLAFCMGGLSIGLVVSGCFHRRPAA